MKKKSIVFPLVVAGIAAALWWLNKKPALDGFNQPATPGVKPNPSGGA